MSHEESSDRRRLTGAHKAQSGKLVFGLSSRTNRLKHDEYAERRMRQSHLSHVNSVSKIEPIKPVTQESSNKSTGKKQQERPNLENTNHVRSKIAAELQNRSSTDQLINQKKLLNQVEETPAIAEHIMKEPNETATRKRFNIPPPPMKSLKSPGKSSVVNYAKSKIYADREFGLVSSRDSVLDSSIVPDSILSGFKPPKQVDVSKARERWEGGEPFAKCKSRQRLQAAKDSKWIQLRDASASFSSSSTTTSSLVAMHQHQLQQQGSLTSSIVDNGPLKVLCRGSVLERAQKFEKIPANSSEIVTSDLAKSEQTNSSDALVKRKDELTNSKATTNEPLSLTSPPLRRLSSTGVIGKSSSVIPRFYHPNGKPNTYELELQKRNIVACFNKLPDRSAQLVNPVAKRHFQAIALVCGLSDYWKEPLLLYVKHQLTSLNLLHSGTGNKRQPFGGLVRAASIENSTLERTNRQTQISCEQFLICWKKMVSSAFDNAARFVHLLTLGQRNHLLPEDFVPLIQSIIDDHPGLVFLRGAPDFHMRYIQTVIARIYFCVNRSWTGKISLAELRASNLLDVIKLLSSENDINKINHYFSYEHFYVIYCKFWCLDQDHDLLISKEDLARHNDSAISARIIERIFQGIVSKQIQKTGKMSYSDFVWFLIAEEDKKQVRSIEYWFRLMDLDGDGYISMYEMEYFYAEQMKRLEAMNIEALPFLDSACQILDLVNPKEKNKISLSDLKQTQMAPIFFDTFINIEKYLEHESKEFVSSRDVVLGGKVVSDWERYASEEYESLVSEESSV